ncbi:HlyC/CorC family transporter [Litoribacillus peritrichatus]|uniref:Magnesium and cobalt efflux protein CorC n=1 Tax=Litoribacillus peritrichatus TaxID=718191 RepID=A0ABP7NB18_9GAMM
MNEDQQNDSHSSKPSWFEKITKPFTQPQEPESSKDLKELLRGAHNRGLCDAEALSIMEGALQVGDMHVREIMVPRSQMTFVRASQSPSEILPIIIESQHSRFPVLGEGQDDLLGILLAKDFLPYLANGNLDRFNIKDVLRPVNFVPESKRLNTLLREFRSDRYHMAIVVDEYGGLAGLVTIEDVLEQIVGDIEDETDIEDDESNIRAMDDSESFMVNALTPIDDFNEYFDTTYSDEEFDTIGGIVTNGFGHLPDRDEAITIEGLRFKVLNSDNRQIRLLEVTSDNGNDVDE